MYYIVVNCVLTDLLVLTDVSYLGQWLFTLDKVPSYSVSLFFLSHFLPPSLPLTPFLPGSQVSQAGLELAELPRMVLNS